MTWFRLHVDPLTWTRFQAWMNEPPPQEEPDTKALEAEGAAFLSFMGAVGGVPDAADGGETA